MWYRSDGWIAWKERGKGRVERRRGRRGGREGRKEDGGGSQRAQSCIIYVGGARCFFNIIEQ